MAGGAIGTLGRYGLSGFIFNKFEAHFPLGTLVVNLLGSFIIGFLWGLGEKFQFSPNMRVFIFVGLLGGFTTFSSFTLECYDLIRSGEVSRALLYLALSNVLGLAFVYFGFLSAKLVVSC